MSLLIHSKCGNKYSVTTVCVTLDRILDLLQWQPPLSGMVIISSSLVVVKVLKVISPFSLFSHLASYVNRKSIRG